MRQLPRDPRISAQQCIQARCASSDSEDANDGQHARKKRANTPLGVGWPGERRIQREVRYWESQREGLEIGKASGKARGFVVGGWVRHGEGFDG